MRLVVLLHGAGGEPGRVLHLLLPFADEHRLLLVAPKSHLASWDVIRGSYGPDVRRTYEEFDGGHTAPRRITREAANWLTGVHPPRYASNLHLF